MTMPRLASLLGLVSCVHLSWIATDGALAPSEDEAVRRSAKRDIPCSSDVTVRRLGRVTAAEGCGVRVTYGSEGDRSTKESHLELTLVMIGRVPIDAPSPDAGTAPTPN